MSPLDRHIFVVYYMYNSVLFQLDSEGDAVEVGFGCGIDSLLQTMIHIREMASDEITEDEMTQSFEKVENQNADCTFHSVSVCV